MMKFAAALVMALLLGVPAYSQAVAGQAEPKKEPAKEEPKKEDKKDAAADAYSHLRTKGNTWTHKSTSKGPGYEMVSQTKYEVTEVTAEKAVVKMTMMDAEGKETFSQNMDMPFAAPVAPVKPVEGEKPVEAPKVETETIKVGAGEIECTKVVTEAGGSKTTMWMHKKYPGVMVKMESKTGDSESTTELTALTIK